MTGLEIFDRFGVRSEERSRLSVPEDPRFFHTLNTLQETETMYVTPNFATKKALKEAVQAKRYVGIFQPGLGTVPESGTVSVEGPHFPKPHTWYATLIVKNNQIIKVS